MTKFELPWRRSALNAGGSSEAIRVSTATVE
jgi:hypothetical protein